MAELTKQPSRKRVRELPISETESGIQEIENRTKQETDRLLNLLTQTPSPSKFITEEKQPSKKESTNEEQKMEVEAEGEEEINDSQQEQLDEEKKEKGEKLDEQKEQEIEKNEMQIEYPNLNLMIQELYEAQKTEEQNQEVTQTLEIGASTAVEIPLMELEPEVKEKLQSVPIETTLESLFQPSILDSEFYRLLLAYRESCLQLFKIMHERELISQSLDELIKDIWKLDSRIYTGQGVCGDGVTVQDSVEVKVARFDANTEKLLKEKVQINRYKATEEYLAILFNFKINNLQVDSYVQLFLNDPYFKNLDFKNEITIYSQNLIVPSQVSELLHLIEVAFHFLRKWKWETDKEAALVPFYRDLKVWTTQLVSVLLRCSTEKEHLFLLHQLIRCRGIASWGANLLQFPLNYGYTTHATEMLCTLLKPISLSNLQDPHPPISLSQSDLSDWEIIDASNNDNLNQQPQSSYVLTEDDFIALFEQFPFQSFFKSMFLDCKDLEDPLMKANLWLELFSTCIQTFFNFSHFVKLLCRTIATLLIGATNLLEQSEDFKLQFDQLFLKAFKALVSVQHIGVWQFISELPFAFISEKAAWNVLGIVYEVKGSDLFVQSAKDWLIRQKSDASIRENFANQLESGPEPIFLLHSLTQLALVFGNDISLVVVTELFLISFVMDQTRKNYYKTGLDFISSILETYPDLHSKVIELIQEYDSILGKSSLYLVNRIPINLWKPSVEKDFVILREWLLCPLEQLKHSLARTIFGQLNWKMDSSKQSLFLHPLFHQKSALLFVECYNSFVSIYGQLSFFSFSSSRESFQEFVHWVWKYLFSTQHYYKGNPLVLPLNLADPLAIGLRKTFELNKQSPDELPDPLLSYACFQLVDIGQNLFQKQTSHLLRSLIQNKKHVALLKVFHDILPVCVLKNKTFEDQKLFSEIIQNIATDDPSFSGLFKFFKENKIRENSFLLASMILNSILSHSDTGFVNNLISLWLKTIFSILDWYQDKSLAFIVDTIYVAFLVLNDAQANSQILEDNFPGMKNGWLFDYKTKYQISFIFKEFPCLAFELLYAETKKEKRYRDKLAEILLIKSTNAIDNIKKVENKPIEDFAIYHWAQFALEFDPQHPLAILCWQVFFHLYFMRVQNISFGQQFLLLKSKQSLKKTLSSRLEYLSQLFRSSAERNKSLGESNDRALQLAQVYNAMHLWLDYSNVNDLVVKCEHPDAIPFDYLFPRLISITQDDVLANRSAFWKDLVDFSPLHNQILHQSNIWTQKLGITSSDEKRPSPFVSKPTFKIGEDKYCLAPPPFEIPPIFVHVIPLDNNFEKSLQKELFVINQITDEHENRVARQVGLDAQFLEYLPRLYSNADNFVQIEKKCSQECKRGAIFNINFSEAKPDEYSIQQSRSNRKEVAQLLKTLDIPKEVCISILRIKKTLETFGQKKQSQDVKDQTYFFTLGSQLFYKLLGMYTENSLLYPPTRAFLQTAIQTLARNFIAINPQETAKLLSSILEDSERRVPLLSEYFNPSNSPSQILEMYQFVLQAINKRNQIKLLILLNKFDFSIWTQTSPSSQQCSNFLTQLVNILVKKELNKEIKSQIIEVFRIITIYGFPTNFGSILKLLLDGSVSKSVPIELWQTVLNRLPIAETLSRDDILQSFDLITEYSWKVRSSAESQGKTIYSLWSVYSKAMINFTLIILKSNHLIPMSTTAHYHKTTLKESLAWQYILKLYEPWLIPKISNLPQSSWFNPWFQEQSQDAEIMFTALIECTNFLQHHFENTINQFFTFLKVNFFQCTTLQDDQQKLLFRCCSKVSWKELRVDFSIIKDFFESIYSPLIKSSPILFQLILDIISQINWSININEETSKEFALHLLKLIFHCIKESSDPLNPTFVQFLQERCIHLPWSIIPIDSLHNFIFNSSAISTLKDKIDVSLLAELNVDNLKQYKLFQFVNLLCRISGLENLSKSDATFEEEKLQSFSKTETIINIIVNILTSIHSPQNVTHVALAMIFEIIKLCCDLDESKTVPLIQEMLELFNNDDTQTIEIVKHLLMQYPNLSIFTMIAATTRIISIQKMAFLVETCMEIYFLISNNWNLLVSTLNVPELDEKEFLEDNLKLGGIFTLYTYSLQQSKSKSSLEILDLLLTWSNQIQLNKLIGREFKLLILWFKIIYILADYLQKNPNDKRRMQQLNDLVQTIIKLAEDKKTEGFFGTFGFGEKSPYSIQFRICCRLLGTFVSCQIKENGTLRSTTVYEPLLLSKMAEKLVATVANLPKLPDYQIHTNTIQTALGFLSDAHKTLSHLNNFLFIITSKLYSEYKCFSHIY